MSQVIGREYQHDYLLVYNALLESVKQLESLPASREAQEIKVLCHAVEHRITTAALNCGLYFRVPKPLAVISGAGVAGLAASFELRARGFNVVIAEKRSAFSRFNVINLKVEAQVFLKRFNLLEKFEKCVAARIKEHKIVVIDKMNAARRLVVSDVSELQLDESLLPFEPKNFHKLFEKDGIYSVSIGALQTFLAENALEAGVNILGNATVKVLVRKGRVATVQIPDGRVLQPDLFFIAEGAHSTTAEQLGMRKRSVANACTGENWIFGNMSYFGKQTFVIALVDTSGKTLRIANVIFNAKSQVINVAVTSDSAVGIDRIREQILQTAHQVFTQKAFPVEEMDGKLLATVQKPVHIANRVSLPVSIGNVFCIGDAAGSSSPLAGLGGSIALTLVPATIRKLLEDYAGQSNDLHKNFREYSEGYIDRWMQKSCSIKELCLGIFRGAK